MSTPTMRTVRWWRLRLARRLLGIPQGARWEIDGCGGTVYNGYNAFDASEFLEFR